MAAVGQDEKRSRLQPACENFATLSRLRKRQRDHLFNVNVRSVWLLSRGALPHMRKSDG